jgi:Sulfotransferase family
MLAFVVGTGRCGSTLVNEVLARHPDVGFISGVDDKLARLNLSGRWNGKLYRRMSARDPGLRALRDSRRLLDRGRLRVAPSEGWSLLDRHVFAGFSRPCRDLLASDLTPYIEARLKEFFNSRVAAQRSKILLHRLTGWPRTGLLQAAFPDLRVIHVVRDGRAVVNSWLQMGWWDGYRGPSNWYLGPLPDDYQEAWEASGRSFPVLAALGWRLLMHAFEIARKEFPSEQWLELRYEDLLARPHEHVEEMLDFLGLEWSHKFEAGLAKHRLEPGRRAAYLSQLTGPHLAAIERVLAEPLTRRGYELHTTDLDTPFTKGA